MSAPAKACPTAENIYRTHLAPSTRNTRYWKYVCSHEAGWPDVGTLAAAIAEEWDGFDSENDEHHLEIADVASDAEDLLTSEWEERRDRAWQREDPNPDAAANRWLAGRMEGAE